MLISTLRVGDPGPVDPTVRFGHVGLCVTDLDRSRRFYTELFGFELLNQLEVPDQPADRLLGLQAPLGLRALYLVKDGFVLELMAFDRTGNPPAVGRPVNQPGLTHLSLSLPDIASVAVRVAELGGTVLEDTDVGAGVFIQDPDGQLIELYPDSYRRYIYGR
jgi:lactoylglutathione lyase